MLEGHVAVTRIRENAEEKKYLILIRILQYAVYLLSIHSNEESKKKQLPQPHK